MTTAFRPPWVAFPDLPRASIGWRRGAGGDYFVRFFETFSAMSAQEQAAFALRYPEPPGWSGFYEMLRTVTGKS